MALLHIDSFYYDDDATGDLRWDGLTFTHSTANPRRAGAPNCNFLSNGYRLAKNFPAASTIIGGSCGRGAARSGTAFPARRTLHVIRQIAQSLTDMLYGDMPLLFPVGRQYRWKAGGLGEVGDDQPGLRRSRPGCHDSHKGFGGCLGRGLRCQGERLCVVRRLYLGLQLRRHRIRGHPEREKSESEPGSLQGRRPLQLEVPDRSDFSEAFYG